MLLLPLLTAGMGGTRCARMTLGWGDGSQLGRRGQWGDTTLCTVSAGLALQLHGPAWGHGAAKMGTWVEGHTLCEAA